MIEAQSERQPSLDRDALSPISRAALGRFHLVGHRLQFLALPLLRLPPQIFLAHRVGGLFDDAEEIEDCAKRQEGQCNEQNQQRL
jgi:hypothetical protein